MERAWRIAKEMSNLIVYCRSVAFNIERIRTKGFTFNEMSSFPETKAEKLMCQQENKFFIKYHQVICKVLNRERESVCACARAYALKLK